MLSQSLQKFVVFWHIWLHRCPKQLSISGGTNSFNSRQISVAVSRLPHHVVISCEMNLNMDYLLEKIWEYLALVRVYTKKPGNAPDLGIFTDLPRCYPLLFVIFFKAALYDDSKVSYEWINSFSRPRRRHYFASRLYCRALLPRTASNIGEPISVRHCVGHKYEVLAAEGWYTPQTRSWRCDTNREEVVTVDSIYGHKCLFLCTLIGLCVGNREQFIECIGCLCSFVDLSVKLFYPYMFWIDQTVHFRFTSS